MTERTLAVDLFEPRRRREPSPGFNFVRGFLDRWIESVFPKGVWSEGTFYEDSSFVFTSWMSEDR